MTVTTAPQVPAGTVRRNGGGLGLLWLHTRTEVRAALRSVEFVIGAVTVPAILYAMFGLPNASESNILPAGTRVGVMMMVSLCCYGVVSLALFTFGEYLAKDRGRGWIRTMRATPLPTWSHLAAKTAMAMLCAALIVASTGGLGVAFGAVRLDVLTWLGLLGTMILGMLAFSTLGFAIAYLVRPRAAAAIANLVFLPLSFLSGFFFPLSDLPGVFRTIAPWLPTYHLGRLTWGQVAPTSDVEAWTGIAPSQPVTSLAWVLGAAAAFGAITLVASRREAVTRR